MPFGGRKTAPLVLKPPKVYEPTMEEFSDFLSFIEKIEREDKIHEIGICKIVPPKEWIPRKSGYNVEDLDYQIEVPLRQCFTQTDHKDCYITKSQPHLPVKVRKNFLVKSKLSTAKKCTNHKFFTSFSPKKNRNFFFIEIF